MKLHIINEVNKFHLAKTLVNALFQCFNNNLSKLLEGNIASDAIAI